MTAPSSPTGEPPDTSAFLQRYQRRGGTRSSAGAARGFGRSRSGSNSIQNNRKSSSSAMTPSWGSIISLILLCLIANGCRMVANSCRGMAATTDRWYFSTTNSASTSSSDADARAGGAPAATEQQQRSEALLLAERRRQHNKHTAASQDNSDVVVNGDDDDAVQQRAVEDPCRGYDGVLRVRSGDYGGAAGTVFFLYVVNHLIYAERQNLLPFVHLDDTSEKVYDPVVHGGIIREEGGRKNATITAVFEMPLGEIKYGRAYVPGDIIPPPKRKGGGSKRTVRRDVVELHGNGVWESYFEPVSSFSPSRNQFCHDANKPLYELSYDGVAGGLHLDASWTVRAWLYGTIGEKSPIRRKTFEDWYRPMRRKGASYVRRYFRVKPWLQEKIDEANPCSRPDGRRLENDTATAAAAAAASPSCNCLAMHVRTTDKELSGGRVVVPLEAYLPYAIQFMVENPKEGYVYLATDSSQTMKKIRRKWPPELVQRIRTLPNAVLSNSSKPVFDLEGVGHHRTNTEILTDVYAMAKCKKFVHGRSAVSESVLYVNPELFIEKANHVDLEDHGGTIQDDMDWFGWSF